jgi:hypothetical protein
VKLLVRSDLAFMKLPDEDQARSGPLAGGTNAAAELAQRDDDITL